MIVYCPRCRQSSEIDQTRSGTSVDCPLCSAAFRAPEIPAAVVPTRPLRRPAVNRQLAAWQRRQKIRRFISFLLMAGFIGAGVWGLSIWNGEKPPKGAAASLWEYSSQKLRQLFSPAPPPVPPPELPPEAVESADRPGENPDRGSAALRPLNRSMVREYRPAIGPDGISVQNYPFPLAKAQLFDNPAEIVWRIPVTTLPAASPPVIGLDVTEFGAKGDGITDDTHAFHLALNKMAAAGGGTVWVPAGRYAIRGTLAIPLNVVLQGEWEKPVPGKPVSGSILMAYADKGDPDGTPFITLDSNCAVRNLTIWYPEQPADSPEPVPYPWTIFEFEGKSFKPCATVENITLVNSYRGVCFGSSEHVHGNWYLRRIYGTPLETGIHVDRANETGRLYNADFAPDYWIGSGLPGAPAADSPLIKWIRENGTAFVIRRQDLSHWGPFSARGYGIGMRGARSLAVNKAEAWIAEQGDAQFQGHFWGLDFRDCGTAVTLGGLQPAGAIFTDCVFEGRDFGMRIEPDTRFFVTMNRCRLTGRRASLESAEPMHLGVLASTLTGPVAVSDGALSLVGCRIADSPEAPETRVLTVQGGSWPQAWADEAAPTRLFDPAPVELELPETKLPDVNLDPVVRSLPVGRLRVVPAGEDDFTAALQRTLSEASSGDVVFVPPGYHLLRAGITIPEGVELRGPIDTPQHVVRSPALIFLDAGLAATSHPIILLSREASVAGLGFFPRGQNWRQPLEFPVLFHASGTSTTIRNVSAAALSNFADFQGPDANGFFVDSVNANILGEGFRIGGGVRGGRVMNVQLISHLWNLLSSSWEPAWIQKVWGYQLDEVPVDMWQDEPLGKEFVKKLQDRFDAYVLGDAADILMYHNFTYGCRSGFKTVEENGRGPNALVIHGAGDVSIVGADIAAASEDGLVFRNFTVYAAFKDSSTCLQVSLPENRSVIFDSLQTTGPARTSLLMSGGNLYLPGVVFSDISALGLLFEAGRTIATGAFFFRPDVKLDIERDAIFDTTGAVAVEPFRLAPASAAPVTRGAVYFQANPPLQKTEPHRQTTPTTP